MRLSIALLTIVTFAATATESQACRFTDWLFGRRAAPVVVGYAPYGAGYAPYGAGYAPIATTPYAAAYAPVPVTTAPALSTSALSTSALSTSALSTSVLRPAWNAAPALSSGAYQVQRPTYYDNPSVYTGLPVSGNVQTSYRLPLRGTVPTLSSVGAVNQAPNTYVSGYSAAQVNGTSPGLPLQVTTPTGAPLTAIPATPVAPLYPVTQPRVGGLRRFFGSLFGTNYRSSYYRAPVTYYRPVTSVDPVSGTTITVQQPCSSYVQQLQRTPYSSLQVQSTPQPSASCQATPTYAPQSYAPQSYAPQSYGPQSYGPPSGVGQVGAVASPGQMAVPIPSTAPATSGNLYAQPGFTPNTAPLTGAPLSTSPFSSTPPASMPPASGSQSGGDLAPVDQPQLQNYPPANGSEGESNQAPAKPESYWKFQEAEDSTAMISPNARRVAPQSDPLSLGAGEFTGATPIRAPDDYVSPFRRPGIEAPAAANTPPTFEAPPLPTRTDPSDATSVSNRTSVPIRDAVLTRTRSSRQAVPAKRDSKWFTIQP